MQSKTAAKLTTYDLVQCGLFVSLIVAGAYIKIMIPLGPFSVTFSLQFLFSLMAGLLMGSKKGAVTVAVYLVLGLVGLPVFAHGGGIGYIIRPTFGFLIGFFSAAAISGGIYERLPNPGFKSSLLAAFAGELSYYFCGLVYCYIFFNYVFLRFLWNTIWIFLVTIYAFFLNCRKQGIVIVVVVNDIVI